MTTLPDETEKSEGVRKADIRGSRALVYDYSSSQVSDARELIQVTSDTEGEGERYVHSSSLHAWL